MPLPPPPALGLMSSGYPMSFATRRAAERDVTGFWVPGGRGTPASAIVARATALSPMRRIASGDGPMNTTWLLAQPAAKSAFSDRKP